MDGTFSVQSFAITNAIDHEGQKIYTPGRWTSWVAFLQTSHIKYLNMCI